jgi:hypothetical protein
MLISLFEAGTATCFPHFEEIFFSSLNVRLAAEIQPFVRES